MVTQENINITYRDGTFKSLWDVWAASWDEGHRVYTVDCRNPATGVGEVWSFPAGAVKCIESSRRRAN